MEKGSKSDSYKAGIEMRARILTVIEQWWKERNRPPSRQELADTLETVPQNVNHHLRIMRRLGIITMTGKKLNIIKPVTGDAVVPTDGEQPTPNDGWMRSSLPWLS